MKQKKRILLCEPHKEIEPVIQPLTRELNTSLVTCTSEDAAWEQLRESAQDLIILNCPDPGPLCHRIKMDSEHYYLPIFVIATTDERNIELQFLSNELFIKPLQTIDLIKKIRKYLEPAEREREIQPGEPQTRTRNCWIEKKTGSTYHFEFAGDFSRPTMESLLKRISELTTVGRKVFTINLLQARHIENIPISLFRKLQDIVRKSGGHLKMLSHITPITDELSGKGIDIDEYVDIEDFMKAKEDTA